MLADATAPSIPEAERQHSASSGKTACAHPPWSGSDSDLVLLIYRQMRALTGPRTDLEDLVQTALEQVLKARFEGRARYSTFTHAICYRVWMKHLRSLYRWRAVFGFTSSEELDEPVESTTPHCHAESGERVENFYRILARVSPKRRAVVALHDISGEDVPAIAKIVGTSEATVRTRLRDGRKRLRQLLAEDSYFERELQEGNPS